MHTFCLITPRFCPLLSIRLALISTPNSFAVRGSNDRAGSVRCAPLREHWARLWAKSMQRAISHRKTKRQWTFWSVTCEKPWLTTSISSIGWAKRRRWKRGINWRNSPRKLVTQRNLRPMTPWLSLTVPLTMPWLPASGVMPTCSVSWANLLIKPNGLCCRRR